MGIRWSGQLVISLCLLFGCQAPVPSLSHFSSPAVAAEFLALCSPQQDGEKRFAGLEKMLAANPGNVLVAWALADLAREQDKAARVRPLFEKLPELHRLVALARLEKDPLRQRRFFKDAIDLDGTFYPALYLRGCHYHAASRFDRAAKTLNLCLALQPDWPLALFELARVRIDQGQGKNAAQLLRRYLKKRPRDNEARLLRAQLLVRERDQLPNARHEVERLEELLPGDGRVGLLTAGLLMKEGKFREAANRYESLLLVPAVQGLAAYNLGMIYMRHLNDPAGTFRAFTLYLKTPVGESLADKIDRLRVRTWLLELQEKGAARKAKGSEKKS